MERRFWPGEDPIGKRFTIEVLSGERPREVIGVVRDIPLARHRPDPEPVLYTPYLQQAQLYRGPSGIMFGKMTFLIRSPGDPIRLVPAAREAIAGIGPGLPISNIEMLDELSGAGLRDRAPIFWGWSFSPPSRRCLRLSESSRSRGRTCRIDGPDPHAGVAIEGHPSHRSGDLRRNVGVAGGCRAGGVLGSRRRAIQIDPAATLRSE